MSNYQFTLNVPPATLKTAPASKMVRVKAGTIKRVRVKYPSGATDDVHIRFKRLSDQIIPANSDDELRGDDEVYDLEENISLEDKISEIYMEAWNDDNINDFDIIATLTVI